MLKIKRGHTLLEAMAVVTVIGIIATIAIPKVKSKIDKAKTTEAVGFIREIGDAEQSFQAVHGKYTNEIVALQIDTSNSGKFNYNIIGKENCFSVKATLKNTNKFLIFIYPDKTYTECFPKDIKIDENDNNWNENLYIKNFE